MRLVQSVWRRASVRLVLLAGVGALAPAAGCGTKSPSVVMVAVMSEPLVPAEVDGIELEVTRGDSTPFFQSYTLAAGSADARLPGTIALAKQDGEADDAPVTVTVRARSGGKEVLLRQATLGFSSGKTKLLRMPLRYACFRFTGVCGPGQACSGNRCEDVQLDVESLPDFDPSQVFGVRGASSCFDDRDVACLASRKAVADLAAFGKAACSLDVAVGQGGGGGAGGTGAGGTGGSGGATGQSGAGKAGAGGAVTPAGNGLNVAVLWKRSVDQTRLVVLDQDAHEGWVGSGTRFTLAPGLCDAVKSGDITQVAYATACSPKLVTQPICASDPVGGSGAGGAAGSAGTGGAPGYAGFAQDYGEAVCDNLTAKCCASAGKKLDRAGCVADIASRYAPAQSAPGYKLDTAAATACLSSIKKSTACGSRLDTSWQCNRALNNGTSTTGGPCMGFSTCARPTVAGYAACDGATGTCVSIPIVGAGAHCESFPANIACDEGLSCSSSTCVPLASLGGSCAATACQPGLRCVGGVCLAPLAVGAPCGNQAPCGGDLYCASDTMVCAKLKPPGAPCTFVSECMGNYGCSKGVCKVPGAEFCL